MKGHTLLNYGSSNGRRDMKGNEGGEGEEGGGRSCASSRMGRFPDRECNSRNRNDFSMELFIVSFSSPTLRRIMGS